MCFAIARAAGKGPENKPSLEVFVEDESGSEESGSDKSDSGPPLCFSPPPLFLPLCVFIHLRVCTFAGNITSVYTHRTCLLPWFR